VPDTENTLAFYNSTMTTTVKSFKFHATEILRTRVQKIAWSDQWKQV